MGKREGSSAGLELVLPSSPLLLVPVWPSVVTCGAGRRRRRPCSPVLALLALSCAWVGMAVGA